MVLYYYIGKKSSHKATCMEVTIRMKYWEKEEEIYNAIQRNRAISRLFGMASGRRIFGDAAADRQLARDIASGMDVRDALSR